DAQASAPTSVSGGDNTANDSTGVVQVGGGNTADNSTGAAQVGAVQTHPSARASVAQRNVTVDAAAGTAGGGNTARNSTGVAQLGGGNSATGSTGAAQSGPITARADANVAGATVSAPANVGSGGAGPGNTAADSTGVVQVGGGNSAGDSTGAAQVGATQASPSAAVSAAGQDAAVTASVGNLGGGNTATDTTGAAQLGGGNTSTGSTGTAQSSSLAAAIGAALNDTGASAPVTVGSGGGTNTATDSTGIVQIGGGGSTAQSAPPGTSPAASTRGLATATAPPPSAASPSAPASAAGTPQPVSRRLGQQATRTQTPARSTGQGSTTARASLLDRVASAQNLPFTGMGLTLWVAFGLLGLALGSLLRLRPRMSGAMIAAISVLLLQAAAASASDLKATSTERSFLVAVNQARTEHGHPAVALDLRLLQAARWQSHDMIEHGYFAHRNIVARVVHAGVRSGEVGENLGWAAETDGSVDLLLRLWLESPTHRSVLLDPRFESVGVGVAIGRFKGWPNAIVVTTDFLDS
ncbi:MAG TPA: CAP domain-containing protein, partial [Gaiellaceae bacterium]